MQIKFVRVVFLIDGEGERRPVTILEDTSQKAYKQAKSQIEMSDLSINRTLDSICVPVYPAAVEFGDLYNLETREKLDQ